MVVIITLKVVGKDKCVDVESSVKPSITSLRVLKNKFLCIFDTGRFQPVWGQWNYSFYYVLWLLWYLFNNSSEELKATPATV